MPKFLAANWQYLTALAAAVWVVFSFLSQRKSELSWKRTEFLFEQARYLETDAELVEIIRVLDGRTLNVTLDAILSEDSELPEVERLRLRHGFDKLLNLFERFHYAVNTAETLQQEEVQLFGWYLDRIAENAAAVSYCEQYGFRDVITLAKANNPESVNRASQEQAGAVP